MDTNILVKSDKVNTVLRHWSPLGCQVLFAIEYASRHVLVRCGRAGGGADLHCIVTFHTNAEKAPAHLYQPPKTPEQYPQNIFRVPKDDHVVACRNALYLIMRKVYKSASVSEEHLANALFDHLALIGPLQRLGIKWNTIPIA